MLKRGRKPKGSEKKVSNKQKIIDESKGLLCLFGNRIVKKYNDEYLHYMKEKYGNDLYLAFLNEKFIQNKYTQEYIEKNRKRNQAVNKYREKKRKFIDTQLVEISRLRVENKKLKTKLDNNQTDLLYLKQMIKIIFSEFKF